jgi:hypothetical protein
VALAACLVLAGCQDDGTPSGTEKPGTSTASPGQTTPTAAPKAGGPTVRGDVFTVNVPEGWKKDKSFSTDFLDQYVAPDGVQRMYVGELAGEVRPLDDVAKDNFDGFAPTGRHRRRRTGDLAGEPAYHFTATDGAGNVAEEFLAVHDGTQVTLGVSLTGTRAERQAIIDSVLASWEWR